MVLMKVNIIIWPKLGTEWTMGSLSTKNISIIDLPKELLEDTIVLEISYSNGKAETKAIKIKLQDNGNFVTSFDNYTITKKEAILKCKIN